MLEGTAKIVILEGVPEFILIKDIAGFRILDILAVTTLEGVAKFAIP